MLSTVLDLCKHTENQHIIEVINIFTKTWWKVVHIFLCERNLRIPIFFCNFAADLPAYAGARTKTHGIYLYQ